MALSIGTEFQLFMTHVESEGPYLKMFGQADKQGALIIESLILSLRDQFQCGVGSVQPSALRNGLLCIAKYHDDSFYRAKITSLHNLNAGYVSVYFIDYGNSDSIPADSIRIMNQNSPDPLKSLPPQATDYLLSSIINPNGVWDEANVTEIRNLIYYQEIACLVELNIYNKYFVKMQFKNYDLSEYLASRKFGIKVNLQEQQFILQKMLSGIKFQQAKNPLLAQPQPVPVTAAHRKNDRLPTNASEMPQENIGQGFRFQMAQNSPHYDPYARNINKDQPVPSNRNKLRSVVPPRPLNRAVEDRDKQASSHPEAKVPLSPGFATPPVQRNPSTYKSRLLELNSQHEVHVSFAKDGPKLFAIQLKSDENFLTSIVSKINSEPPKSLSEPPMIGSVCLGRFSEDNTLCRAVVMGLTPSQCKLFFVDFGMTESVSYSDIFYIPEDFVTPCVFALRFSLSGIMGLQVTEEIKHEFYEIVNNKVLILRVVPPEGPPLIQYCELTINGRSVKDMLLQKQNPSFLKMDPATITGEHSVLVSYVDSCTKFFIQLSENIDALNTMMAEVEEHCESTQPLLFHQVKCGMVCCALFPDDHNWYRALVTNIKKDKITVNYIDYGNDQEVTADSLRPIPINLIKMKAQAIHCALKSFEDKPFDQLTSDNLESLTLEKILCMRVQGLLEGGVLLVELLDQTHSPPVLVSDAIKQAVAATPPPSSTPAISPQCQKVFEENSPEQPKETYGNKRGKSSYDDKKNNHDDSDKSFGSRDGDNRYSKPRRQDRGDNYNQGSRGYDNKPEYGQKSFGGLREPHSRINQQGGNSDNASNSSSSSKHRAQQYSHKKSDKTHSSGGFGSQYQRENKADRFYKAVSGREDSESGRKPYSDRSGGQGNKYDNNFRNDKFSNDNNYSGRSYEPKSSYSSTPVKSLTNPASFEMPFGKYSFNDGDIQDVRVSWFTNPGDFYVQILNQEDQFKTMMLNIPNMYSGIKATCADISIGASVLARFPEDKVLYRAKVIDNNCGKCVVQFVDFGNKCEVTGNEIWQLESELMDLPRLSVHCILAGVSPVGDNWKNSDVDGYFSGNSYKCTIHNELADEVFCVSLQNEDGTSVAQKLIENNIAVSDNSSIAGSAAVNISVPTTTVFVTHIDTPGQFWLQLESDTDKINSLQEILQGADSFEDYLDHEVNKLCISKYSADEQFYRTTILDSDSDIITVRFIDYGNTDVLDNTPGILKVLPAEMQEIGPYAMKCSVNATPTGTGQWTEQASEHFTQLLGNTENPIDAVFILKGATTYVNLYVESQNTTDKLVAAGHAAHAEKSDENDLPTCFASHVNSPLEFWIQLESSIHDLEAISEELVNAADFPPLNEIAEEAICVAKFPEDDLWYRAQVIIHGSDGTEVLFMDYGNASLTNELRSLPENLRNLPALSRKCALQKPGNIKNWSKEAELKFAELAADGATIFNISFIASGDISIVELFIDGKSVTEELLSLCEFDTSTPDRLPLVGEDKMSSVGISFSNSSDDFWIQYMSSTDNLNKITAALEDAESFENLNDIEVGVICASKFTDDSLWYRSKILDHGENGIRVFHIDFGSTAVTSSLRALPEDLQQLPPLAQHCSLVMHVRSSELYKQFQENFSQFASDDSQEYYMEIIDSSCDPMTIKLFLNGQDVIQLLLTSDISSSGDTEVQNKENIDYNHSDTSDSLIAGNEIELKVSAENSSPCVVEDSEVEFNSHDDVSKTVDDKIEDDDFLNNSINETQAENSNAPDIVNEADNNCPNIEESEMNEESHEHTSRQLEDYIDKLEITSDQDSTEKNEFKNIKIDSDDNENLFSDELHMISSQNVLEEGVPSEISKTDESLQTPKTTHEFSETSKSVDESLHTFKSNVEDLDISNIKDVSSYKTKTEEESLTKNDFEELGIKSDTSIDLSTKDNLLEQPTAEDNSLGDSSSEDDSLEESSSKGDSLEKPNSKEGSMEEPNSKGDSLEESNFRGDSLEEPNSKGDYFEDASSKGDSLEERSSTSDSMEVGNTSNGSLDVCLSPTVHKNTQKPDHESSNVAKSSDKGHINLNTENNSEESNPSEL